MTSFLHVLGVSALLLAFAGPLAVGPLAADEAQPEAAPETAQPEADQPDAPQAKTPGELSTPLERHWKNRITGVETLEALVKNRTQYRTRSDGSFEVEYQSPDGISAYLWEGCVIRGEWWTTEDEICFFYPDNDLQGPHCFYIEKGEKGLEFWWSGNPFATEPTATTVRDVEGNSEQLPVGVNGECVVS